MDYGLAIIYGDDIAVTCTTSNPVIMGGTDGTAFEPWSPQSLAPEQIQQLDLTDEQLRQVEAVHREYLNKLLRIAGFDPDKKIAEITQQPLALEFLQALDEYDMWPDQARAMLGDRYDEITKALEADRLIYLNMNFVDEPTFWHITCKGQDHWNNFLNEEEK